MRLSLVSTVHAEKGRASVLELHAILERLRPEVIFLEVPADGLDQYLDAIDRQTLESQAVLRYRQSNHVELVPVDLPTPSLDFFHDNERLFTRIEVESRDYCRLVDWHGSYVRHYGFAYLNSDHCSKLNAEIDVETRSTIERIGDPELTALFDLWNSTIRRRDVEMITNIRQYCAVSTLERGVFLVGAAHRQSLIELWNELSPNDSNTMELDVS
jgi:hypothetical protein